VTRTEGYTCGGDMGTDRQKRASRKWVSAILQSVLKHQPTYIPYDAKRDFNTQFGVTLTYDNVWWVKELAQNDLYGLARHSYDNLRW